MAPASKRLALFFDGTDNTQTDNTNVWRAHQLVADVDTTGNAQLKHYIQGVGTDVGHIARGSIFGSGVIERICKGYRWLAENYQEGDEIFVFGFSRGAFTARSIVQLISNCGLPTAAALAESTPERAFKRYESISQQETELLKPLWRLRRWQRHPDEAPPGWIPNAEESLLLDSSKTIAAKVQMAGLWDTVGAIGSDALKNDGSRTQKSAAHNVRPTAAQLAGYHALAIDEHRPMFDVTLWRRFVPDGEDPAEVTYKDYEQRWFVGAHSDVGGGYADGRLQDLSFEWMLEKATKHGLTFTSEFTAPPGVVNDAIHDSFSEFAYGVLDLWNRLMPGDQRHYREIGKPSRPVTTARGQRGALVTINESLDASVFRRWTSDRDYRPPSLRKFFRRHPDQEPK